MNLMWDNAIDECEALFDHMVDLAFNEDTPENEKIRDAVWCSELMLKYFDHERFKSDMLKNGWVIVQSEKGYAISKFLQEGVQDEKH